MSEEASSPRADGDFYDEDFYMEGANLVFTAAYHRRRGYCCGSGCRHCPYGDEAPPPQKTPVPRQD